MLRNYAEALFTLPKLRDPTLEYFRSGLRPVLRKLLLQLTYAPSESHVLCPQPLLGVLVIALHMSAR